MKFSLVDVAVDLDVANPRDYPYLRIFPIHGWMILVRHPQCWRFPSSACAGPEEPSAEELRDKVLSFIAITKDVQVIGKVTYRSITA